MINCLGLGDVLVTIPVLKALRDRYPDSVITFLVRPPYEEIVKGLPFITDYILYRKQDGPEAIFATLKKIWRYDMALCLDFNYRSAVLPCLALIPVRAGVRHRRGLFLTHAAEKEADESNRYQPYNLASAIYRSLGISLAGGLDDLYLPSPDERQLCEIDRLLAGAGEFITVAPYSTSRRKNWPAEYYARLISALGEQYRIFVLGSASDAGRAAFGGAVDLAGKTTLLAMGEIIRRARLFIGGCSGPLHIAGAVGTPAVAIYTATSPRQWAPRRDTTVLYNRLPCSPCVNKGVKCEDYACTRSIGVDEALAACRRLLAQPRDARDRKAVENPRM